MHSNSEKTLDKAFDYMDFSERVIYIFKLGFNLQTRGQVEAYERRLPIEQQLALSQIRCKLSNYLSDRTIQNTHLELAEEADKRTISMIRGFFGVKEDAYCDLPNMLFELGICNDTRHSALLSACLYRSLSEDDKQGVESYIKALDIDNSEERLTASSKLSKEEIELVESITDPDFVAELEKKRFPDSEIKKLWSTLLKIEEIAFAREWLAYNKLMEKYGDEEYVETITKQLKEQVERFGHYDII